MPLRLHCATLLALGLLACSCDPPSDPALLAPISSPKVDNAEAELASAEDPSGQLATFRPPARTYVARITAGAACPIPVASSAWELRPMLGGSSPSLAMALDRYCVYRPTPGQDTGGLDLGELTGSDVVESMAGEYA